MNSQKSAISANKSRSCECTFCYSFFPGNCWTPNDLSYQLRPLDPLTEAHLTISKQATLTENESTFLAFHSFFPPLFRIDFWPCLHHQNDTRVTYIKSHDTQKTSGEVSPDVAVPLGVLDANEVDVISSRFLCLFWKKWGKFLRTQKRPARFYIP